MNYLKVAREVFEPIAHLVKVGLYRDEEDALKRIVHEHSINKIQKYKKKIKEMEQKYKMNFNAFKEKINTRQDMEVFEEWDDYILWESYEEALKYWKKVEDIAFCK